MEQLIELLKQIQELAGVGVDALKEAGGKGDGEKPPAEGRPGEPGEPASEARAEGEVPPSAKMAQGREGGGPPQGGMPPRPPQG